MPRILVSADVTLPELPRVRFIKRLPAGSPKPFEDVTLNVARVTISSLDDKGALFALEREDKANNKVWSTRHQSIEEARWQAEFEYQVRAEDWKSPVPETSSLQ